MSPDEYRKLRLVDMQARRWRTRRELQNGVIKIPEGTEVEIINKRNGLSLHADACPHCGISVFITRVPPGSVEEIREEE